MKFLLIFLGGGAGSVLRYSMGLLVERIGESMGNRSADESPHWLMMYPSSTFLVNIIGCGLIGIAWGMLGEPKDDQGMIHALLIVGLLGGFTTFSSFGWETMSLINSGRVCAGIGYVILSVLVGLLSAWGGHGLGMMLAR